MNDFDTTKVPRRRRRLLLLAGAGVLLIGAVAGYFWWRHPAVTPPEPWVTLDVAGIDPAVASVLETARAAVLRSPRAPDGWGRLGMLLSAHGFYGQAQDCYARAEQLDPRDPRWPYYQAFSLVQTDVEAALPKLRRAVELCGNDPDAPRLQLAELLLAQGQLPEAEAEFRHLLRQAPAHPRAHLGLARLACARDDPREGLALLGPAADSPYTRKACQVLKTEILQRLGDAQAAQQELRRTMTAPEDARWPDPFLDEVFRLRVGEHVHHEQVGRLLREHRPAEASERLQELVRDYPRSAGAWEFLGTTRLGQGDARGAEQAFRQALALAPDAFDTHINLGIALVHQGNQQAAAACFRRAADLKPDSLKAYYNLGLCLKAQGDRAAALSAFRNALRCKPSFAPAHANLGLLLVQEGRKAEALEHIRLAAQLSPSDPKIQELLEDFRKPEAPP